MANYIVYSQRHQLKLRLRNLTVAIMVPNRRYQDQGLQSQSIHLIRSQEWYPLGFSPITRTLTWKVC